jgi:hypothetical protein
MDLGAFSISLPVKDLEASRVQKRGSRQKGNDSQAVACEERGSGDRIGRGTTSGHSASTPLFFQRRRRAAANPTDDLTVVAIELSAGLQDSTGPAGNGTA